MNPTQHLLQHPKVGVLIKLLLAFCVLVAILSAPQRAHAASTMLYGRERLYTLNAADTAAIKSSYSTVILFVVDVEANGDLNYNGNHLLVQSGKYVGDTTWATRLAALRKAPTTVNRIEVCTGGSGAASWTHIKDLIASGGIGPSSILYRNFQVLQQTLGIDAIDNDDEVEYDAPSAVKFATMIAALGMKFTLAPYTYPQYWQDIKTGLDAAGLSNELDAVYLQCYDGGQGNDPAYWNTLFGGLTVEPGLSVDGSFHGPAVQQQMATWAAADGITSGFMWVLDDTNSVDATSYATAIYTGLGGPTTLGGLVKTLAGSPAAAIILSLTDTKGKPVKDASGNPVGPYTTTSPSTPEAGEEGDAGLLNYDGLVPPGKYLLTASAPGYITTQPMAVTVQVLPFTRHDLVIAPAPGTVGGLVTNKATGLPLAGATVTILNKAGSLVATVQTVAQPSSPPAPAGDGSPLNYSASLTAGDYSLVVSAAGYASSASVAFTITADGFVRQDAALTVAPSTVGGLVTVAGSSNPLGGATVTITDTNGNPVKDSSGNAVGPFLTSATTSAPGQPNGDGNPLNYKGSVPSGTYLVHVSAPNTVSPPAVKVVAVAGAFVRADVVLTQTPGTIGGLVQDTAGHLLGGATVSILDSNGKVVTTFTSDGTPTQTTVNAADGDGMSVNYRGPVAPGTYTITVTDPGYGSSARSSVTITSSSFMRENFTLTSSLGTLGGFVANPVSGSALGGALVSAADSTGKVVATTTTSSTTTSSSSPQGDGQPTNYTLPLVEGAYTVTISERGYTAPAAKTVQITAGAFTRADFAGTTSLTPIHVFPAGLNFVSVPYDFSGAGAGFDALFGTLNTNSSFSPASNGSNRSHIFVYNPAQLQYVLDPTPPADTPRLGQGYWVFLINPSAVTTPASTAGTSTIAVALQAGWNMIGVPSLTPISVSGVSGLHFANGAGGGSIDFASASSTSYQLISGTLYGYNGTDYTALTAGGMMQPWNAYWIYAYVNTTVLIPTN